ncbi:plasma membrane H+-ATPase [Lithohypha guttulata]|uniref:plasma membrane H+-ATPase n=1 Tax=Lithohypha guttulata TaxID=1690604 RepID=UPI002DDF31CC|nr:plasma membrane H+-ATPase [Lithohypha guttulata]
MSVKLLPDYVLDMGVRDWVEATLLCYYPLTYLGSAVNGLEEGEASPALCLFIALTTIGPLTYAFLSRHAVLDKEIPILIKNYMFRILSTKDDADAIRQDFEAMDSAQRVDEDNRQQQQRHRPLGLPAYMTSTDISTGLSSTEVVERQRYFGQNRLYIEPSWKFLIQRVCGDPDLVVVLVSIVPALLSRQYKHLACISLLIGVCLQPIVEQTRSAFRPHPLITWNQKNKAIVLRNGTMHEIAMLQLVPGDIVHLEVGSYLPADGRIIALEDTLEMDNAYIFGESSVQQVIVGLRCNATSRVITGNAFMLVEGTGLNTLVGRTNSRSPGSTRSKPSRKIGTQDHVLVEKLTLNGIAFLHIIVCFWLFRHLRIDSTFRSLRLGVGLAIALSRSGPRSLSTHRAVGMGRLATSNGCIVARLASIDALAGVNVLCIDKTGSLSENWLVVHEPYCVSGSPEEVMTTACLSSSPRSGADPVDAAFSRGLKRFPRAQAEVERHNVLDFEPFSHETKRMQCLVESSTGARMLCAKGAPKAILELCEVDDKVAQDFKEAVASFAYAGNRILGVARKYESEPWQLMGVVPLSDPARRDTRLSLEMARRLRVSVKMLTGDSMAVAKAFAHSVGSEDNVVVPMEYPEPLDTAAEREIELADVYAECFPADRKAVLTVLQSRGHRVAITGDDVSHVLALDQAECGIAVEGSVEAAQGAADLIMLKPGVSRIVNTLRICRQIFQQGHNSIVEQTVRSTHTILVMTFYASRYGEILPLFPILGLTTVLDLLKNLSSEFGIDIPYSITPVKWSFRKLLGEIVSLTATLSAGSWFIFNLVQENVASITWSDHSSFAALTLHDVKIMSISYIVVSECWLSYIINSGGRPWYCLKDLKQTIMLMVVLGLLTTASVQGLLGQEYQLHLATAHHVWLMSLSAMLTSMCLLAVTSSTGQIDSQAA